MSMLYAFVYLYCACFGYYATGMFKYNRDNNHNKKTNHNETYMGLVRAIGDEEKELDEATSPIEVLLEFNDVCHTHIKFFGYIYDFPDIITFIIAYLFCPLTAMKHGYRYWKHGCIRNKPHCIKTQNKNHQCTNRSSNNIHNLMHVMVISCLFFL